MGGPGQQRHVGSQVQSVGGVELEVSIFSMIKKIRIVSESQGQIVKGTASWALNQKSADLFR